MNGADLVGCDATCDDPNAPHAGGKYIESGGLWVAVGYDYAFKIYICRP